MRTIVLFLTLLSLSCDRDDAVTTQTPVSHDPKELKVIYKDTLTDKLFNSIPLNLVDNELLFSYQTAAFKNRFQKRSIQTGEIIWETPIIHGSVTVAESGTYYQDGNIYNGTCNFIVSINQTTGQENWRSEEIDHCHIASVGSHLYGSKPCGNPIDSTTILAINRGTGHAHEVMQLYREEDRYPDVRAMTGYVNENGDEIIIAAVNMFLDQNSNDHSADIYCYNATQDTLIWQKKNIEGEPMFGYLVNQPGIPKIDLENQLVYLHFSKAMYCLDLTNGNVIWDRYFMETNMFSSNHLIYEDKLIWQDDMGYLIAVNRFTGELLYRKFVNDGTLNRMAIWNGKVVVCFHKIQLLEPSTGEIWKSVEVPSSGVGKAVSQPVFDDSNKRMYFTDGYAIVCAEIPDSWLE